MRIAFISDTVVFAATTNPAIEMEEWPPRNLVLLSHYHGDHSDRIAETQLPKGVPIVTTRHAAAKLRAKGLRGPWRWTVDNLETAPRG